MNGQPSVFMIGGPNGAGKTTAALSLMPSDIDCYEYVNADEIAHGLSPYKMEEVSVQAGKLMLKRINGLAARGVTFAFETTMAARHFKGFLESCRQRGYNIQLIYVWLRSADLAVARVEQRIADGGHVVPEQTIRQRYIRGLKNFLDIYAPIADGWVAYDNSGDEPMLIAEKLKDRHVEIKSIELWSLLQESAHEP